jgi:hypothetical protein
MVAGVCKTNRNVDAGPDALFYDSLRSGFH